MIKIIYGSKGTGKTKQIIDMANAALEKTSGYIVFLADTNRYVREIKYAIRFLNTKETEISGEESLIGFIKGLISANYDIKEIYIDGAARMLGAEISDMGSFMARLDAIAKAYGTEFILTVSCDREVLPEFIANYIS
ncbi:MAG: ATP-binding protein [Clostridia bacterium]|nr:ATP-binding protein [Clostridia bacterium]